MLEKYFMGSALLFLLTGDKIITEHVLNIQRSYSAKLLDVKQLRNQDLCHCTIFLKCLV